MSIDKKIQMDTGDPVLLDGLGAVALKTMPLEEVGVMLDLEGRLNKMDIRIAHRFLMTPEQAIELIVELAGAVHDAKSHL